VLTVVNIKVYSHPIKDRTRIMKKHPDKHIRAAIDYAVANGWHVVDAGKSAHAFCRLYCNAGHAEHMMSVWSTPRSPENHARQIMHKVDQCLGEESDS
jgi:hypothetical protein